MDYSEITQLLKMATDQEATDIHLVVNRPPIFRIHGKLVPAALPAITEEQLKGLIFKMLDEEQKTHFKKSEEYDFSFFLEEFSFRCNIHSEKGNLAATIRIVPSHLKSIEELLIPPAIFELAKKRQGLIIISGTAGSGKTTTLTHLVNIINNERPVKIITIEDPIEYVHKSRQSLIIQREVGTDTASFQKALKYALRQDPDVVVVGEMRDLESITMALTTAETGHLVISTVHAPDAIETINRIIDVFPGEKQNQIRSQLSENLIGVIGQTLIPHKDGNKRVLATEVLIPTLAIRNLIRRGSLLEIRGQMEAGGSRPDAIMQTLEQCLSSLVRKGMISRETALDYAKHKDMMRLPEEALKPVLPKTE